MKHQFLSAILLFSAILFSQSLTLQYPNGGETFAAGDRIDIQWTSTSVPGPALKVVFSLNNGAYWKDLGETEPGATHYGWTVPYLLAPCAQVRVGLMNINNHVVASSSAPFSIQACANDPSEPDNSFATAAAISMGDTLHGRVLAIDQRVDSNNVEVDYYKFHSDSGKLVSIYAIPEYRDDAAGIYSYNDKHEVPQINIRNAEGSRVAYEHKTGVLNFPVEVSGDYYIAINSQMSYPTNLDLGWYQYGLTLFTTDFEKIDLLRIRQDSTWIDSIQKNFYQADITGFACGVSIYMESIGGPGGSLTWCILRAFPPVPKPASYADLLIFGIDLPAYMRDEIFRADVTVPYKESDLHGFPESDLLALYYNDTLSTWQNVSFTIDSAANNVIIHTTHFSTYGIFAGNRALQITGGNANTGLLDFKAFPVPANPSVALRFSIPKSGFVDLKICDLNGRVVATVLRENKTAGSHTVAWDGQQVSSGVYVAVLKTSWGTLQRKIIVLK